MSLANLFSVEPCIVSLGQSVSAAKQTFSNSSTYVIVCKQLEQTLHQSMPQVRQLSVGLKNA
jgi:hypothetical protein